ncbi:hypothetical protein Bca101_009784 [Brassica carinata]
MSWFLFLWQEVGNKHRLWLFCPFQAFMEMVGAEYGNMPKSYSLNMLSLCFFLLWRLAPSTLLLNLILSFTTHNCDAGTSKAADEHSWDQTAAETVPAHIAEFLSFQSELARSEAEETENPARDASPRPAFPTPGLPAEGVTVADMSMPDAEFVSFIVGMIAKCGSEVERLAKELAESRESSSLGSVNLSGIGKTASSLLKAKEAKAAKSSELRRLKRVKSGEESTACVIEEAKESVRTEFRTRLARISDALDSLAIVHVKELAVAGVDGGISEIQLFPGKAAPSPRAEEVKLSAHRAELADEEGDFDQILAGLNTEYTLLPCSGASEGQDSIAEEGGGSAVPNPEGMIGEEETPCTEDD